MLKNKTNRFLGLLFLFILGIARSASASPAPVTAGTNFFGVESTIHELMKQSRVPGLSVAVFSKGAIVYAKGFGVKNLITGEAVDPETLFEAASLSKPLTAYAALQMVTRKQLRLDRPLAQYLGTPYLFDRKAAAKITLRMVLSHTSGLPNDALGIDRNVYFNPGDHFSYSGGGFRYLQAVMESLSHLPFAEYMDRELLKPLAMSRSSFVLRDDLAGNMAYGHQDETAFPLRRSPALAAGSLLSTPTDVARFGIELCRPTLLPAATVTRMLTPSVKINPVYAWGLGIGLCRTSAGELAWHWGNNGIYQSFMVILPGEQCGVVIMTNSSNGLQIAPQIAISFLNGILEKPIDNLDEIAKAYPF